MASKTAEKYGLQAKGSSKLEWVPLSKLRVNQVAQREFNQSWAERIFSEFNLDKMQTPHVSQRAGQFNIIDGQHTIWALKKWIGAWEDQHVECRVYSGLSDQDEADMFLALNNKKNVDNFQRFKAEITAAKKHAVEIVRIVEAAGCVISKEHVPGGIRAVGTLKRVLHRDGADALQRSLVMAKESWGDYGLEACVIDGLGMLARRYNGTLDVSAAVSSLREINGGVKGLVQAAGQLRLKTGNNKADCVAAAAVTVINRNRSGKARLASWWKE